MRACMAPGFPGQLDGMLQQLTGESVFTRRVEALINERISNDMTDSVSMREIAKSCGIAVRTFQRWLREENTTFKAVKNRALVKRSTTLITQSDLSLEEIATKLGFVTVGRLSEFVMVNTGVPADAFLARRNAK